MVVDLRLIGTFTLCGVLLSLGLLVVARDPRALVNRLFAFSMVTIIGWIGSISLYLSTRDSDPNIFLGRLGFASATAIPFSLLWMFESLQDNPTLRARRTLSWAALVCSTFVVLSLTPLIVAGSAASSTGRNFIYGPLHPLFGAYFLTCFVIAIYRLSKQLRSASGMRKLQLRYLLLGILLGGAGGTTTNLVVPLVWGTSRYSLLGPYFTLIMAGFAAHAIIRYRLLDIRVVIKSGVVYASGIAVAVSLFVSITSLLRLVTGDRTDSISLTAALAIAVVTAVLFQPLNTSLQTLLNRYLYRRRYDFQRTVRDTSRGLSTILDPTELLHFLVNSIEGILKVERACVYLRSDPRGGTLSIVAASGQWALDRSPSISEHNALPAYLRREKRACVRDDVVSSHDTIALAAKRELRQLDGEAALPLVEDGVVTGFLLVGPKLSGDPYFAEDLDLVSTLVNQATIALKNAQLYREVVIANEYIENILSTMESGVIAVAADGTVTLFNAAAEEMTHLQAASLKGKSIEMLPPSLADALRQAARGGEAQTQIEMVIDGQDGQLVPIISSSSTLKDRSGSLLGAVAVFSNLSRVKELEREKRRVERLASIGALASGIAHEIKNPLVAIKTFAELLPERFSDEEFHNDFAKVVVREIDRIDALVARLRGLTPTAQRMVALDITVPIQETLALLRAQLEQARIVATTSLHSPLPMIAGNADQLKQLFLNVFVNAIEAMSTGGRLDVRLVTQRALGSEVVIAEIEDTGGGIPASVLSKIFDPFVTTKERGSGLGLSICRVIADAHRASIYATNSASGRGAVVVVEFPVLTRESIATSNGIDLGQMSPQVDRSTLSL
jgi:PAS domain S-box-containing protein